jgi:hypothetical protein
MSSNNDIQHTNIAQLIATLCSLSSVVMFKIPFLLIEFLDELVFGVNESGWPLIRTDLRSS